MLDFGIENVLLVLKKSPPMTTAFRAIPNFGFPPPFEAMHARHEPASKLAEFKKKKENSCPEGSSIFN